MKKQTFLVFVLCLLTGCVVNAQKPTAPPIAIAIHGGAGTILKKNMTPEKERAIKEVLRTAVQAGYKRLQQGESSQEAVVAAIHVLEDSPLFNAGKGAVLNALGEVELDASFMEGKSRNAGAVAGVRHVRNPIDAAVAVMESSPHVMLVGAGADSFAQEQGLTSVEQEYFITPSRQKSLKKLQSKLNKAQAGLSAEEDLFIQNQRYGTVGCVALDRFGNLAAGTSTGGMTNKQWNRVGDAPIIGAGTYADNASCAISATGWGEYFIRNVVAYDIAAQMMYGGRSLADAAQHSIHQRVAPLGGDGGIIGLDASGQIVMEMNTPGMYRASIDVNGTIEVKIYADE